MQKNPFLKYVMKDNKEDVFHSSAYAKAQSGASIGAASSETYQVRVNISQSRKNVRGYKDSEIMTGTRNMDLKAETFNPAKETVSVKRGAATIGGDATARAAMPVKNPGISLKK